MMTNEPPRKPSSRREELVVAGSELIDQIKKLAAEGNVRRVILKKPDGDLLLEIPLMVGVVASGAIILAAPVLAALGALAALVAEVRLEIVRKDDGDDVE